jgi:hypothetical protein
MTVKFIQFFDILPGETAELRNFAYKNYIPGINDTGFLRMVGSWYVAAGEGPYCIFESVSDSVNNINKVLQMDEFNKLNHLLHFLTTNYKTKILAPIGLVEAKIPEGRNFRFNHHYNIKYDQYEDYLRFVKEEHLPTIENLGITIIGSSYVAIGPGPHMVMEGACSSVRQILRALGSKEYKSLISKMLAMVSDFGSKILVPTGLV